MKYDTAPSNPALPDGVISPKVTWLLPTRGESALKLANVLPLQ